MTNKKIIRHRHLTQHKGQDNPDPSTKEAYTKYHIIRPAYEKTRTLADIARTEKVSLRTLARWLQNYRQHGLTGLTRKKRSLHSNSHPTLSHPNRDLLDCAQGLALQNPKMSIATIHRHLKVVAENTNQQLPSYHRIYRTIASIAQDILTLAHQGERCYEETFDLLYSHEAEHANQVWQADHTLLDIYLLNHQGKPQRPWLTFILDDYSRAIAGYYIFFEAPSSLHTSLALRQAIWPKEDANWPICGIPEKLYTDHGSDFTSHHMKTVSANLKIQLMFSNVGKPRGRGKIERLFLTFNQKFLANLPGYIHQKDSTNQSLLNLQDFEVLLKDFILTNYHTQNHSSTHESPIARWSKGGFLPQLPTCLEQLDDLLVRVSKARKIQQDGIHFQGLRYLDPILAAYVGEDVMIRYDPRDMAEVRVFYEDRFLCRSICPQLSTQHISFKEIQKARQNRKKELKLTIKQRKSLVDQLLYSQLKPPSSTDLNTQNNSTQTKSKNTHKLKLYEHD